jgi:hypothetical protein
MIRFLFWLFAAGFAYGIYADMIGAGLISLGMAVLMIVGERLLDQRDEEFDLDDETDSLMDLEFMDTEPGHSKQ